MWVKICANTTLADARQAAEAGADAVGFVFAPSKRQVTASQVRDIVAGLPATIERVGVFADLPPEEIAAAAIHAGLTAIQQHGVFNPEHSARLTQLLGPGIALIQTVHWTLDHPEAEADVASGLQHLETTAPSRRALLDARVGATSGGLGLAFDWHAAARVLATQPQQHIILAGGLRPETVAEAIRTVRPWGIDVASGVERQPGIKDREKVKEFIKNARGA